MTSTGFASPCAARPVPRDKAGRRWMPGLVVGIVLSIGAAPAASAVQAPMPAEIQAAGAAQAISLGDAIRAAADRHRISHALARCLLQAFADAVDFDVEAQPGNYLRTVVRRGAPGSGRRGPTLLAAELATGGVRRFLYRAPAEPHRTATYVDARGDSLRTALARKPVPVGRLKARFGLVVHPILGYARLHPGVDWEAPTGTPVMAAGDGTIAAAQWRSGYGRLVEIDHRGGYQTAYAHLSAFAPRLGTGVRVRQGQVIGYVGSTGISSGPHLHYEIRLDSRPVDPMTVALPPARTLTAGALRSFASRRARLDAAMARLSTRIDLSPRQRSGMLIGRAPALR